MTRADVLRAFLRGEGSTDDLRSLGITIRGTPGNLAVEYGPSDSETIADLPLEDLAHGLLVAWARGSDLQEWASLLVMVDWINVESIEFGDGQVLWEAVWSAAGGDEITDEAIDIAKRVAG